jgi:hypothetical protein
MLSDFALQPTHSDARVRSFAMKRSVNLLVAVASAFAVVVVAAAAVAAVVNTPMFTATAAKVDAVYSAEALSSPMPPTRASTVYFDGINEGVIAIGAYE